MSEYFKALYLSLKIHALTLLQNKCPQSSIGPRGRQDIKGDFRLPPRRMRCALLRNFTRH